jgi:hypothetical protein
MPPSKAWSPSRACPERVLEAGAPEPPQEGALQEAVGVLDRGRLRDHHQQADVGGEEEVERGRARAGAEIDDEVVHRQPLHLLDEARALRRPRVGDPARIALARDQPQPGDGGLDDDVLDLRHALLEEIGQGDARPLDADEGVHVGAAEIGIEQDHPFAQRRQVDGDVGREQRLAGAALAPTHRDDPLCRPVSDREE